MCGFRGVRFVCGFRGVEIRGVNSVIRTLLPGASLIREHDFIGERDAGGLCWEPQPTRFPVTTMSPSVPECSGCYGTIVVSEHTNHALASIPIPTCIPVSRLSLSGMSLCG